MSKPNTEAALATYGTIIAIILSISALAVGFSKTNIFAALAFAPMIVYFLHEFFHKIFPSGDDPEAMRTYTSSNFSLGRFLLQDSLMFRLTLSLFIVCIVAVFAKAYVSADLVAQVSQDISTTQP